MSDVTGPISTLPGAVHATPPGTKCDDHPERDAVKRVQGETDSFGSEMHDLCQECFDRRLEESKKPDMGTCDWCKTPDLELRPMRDMDEGMAGPVYYVCTPCRRKYHESVARELGQ